MRLRCRLGFHKWEWQPFIDTDMGIFVSARCTHCRRWDNDLDFIPDRDVMNQAMGLSGSRSESRKVH